MEKDHLELAKEAVKNNDILTASVEATKAIEENPDNYEAYVLRGQICMAFGDKKGAAEDLQRAIEINPDLLSLISGEYKNENGSSCH